MKTEPSTKIVNGKSITYLDVIYNNSEVQFGFLDRIRILFGKKLMTDLIIYTGNESCLVIDSEARYCVEPFFKAKSIPMVHNPELAADLLFSDLSKAKFTNEPEKDDASYLQVVQSEPLKKGDSVTLVREGVSHEGHIAHVNVDGSIDIITTRHGARFNDVWEYGHDNSTTDIHYLLHL